MLFPFKLHVCDQTSASNDWPLLINRILDNIVRLAFWKLFAALSKQHFDFLGGWIIKEKPISCPHDSLCPFKEKQHLLPFKVFTFYWTEASKWIHVELFSFWVKWLNRFVLSKHCLAEQPASYRLLKETSIFSLLFPWTTCRRDLSKLTMEQRQHKPPPSTSLSSYLLLMGCMI